MESLEDDMMIKPKDRKVKKDDLEARSVQDNVILS